MKQTAANWPFLHSWVLRRCLWGSSRLWGLSRDQDCTQLLEVFLGQSARMTPGWPGTNDCRTGKYEPSATNC
eukprot:5542449-Amphidinium_carterae.1